MSYVTPQEWQREALVRMAEHLGTPEADVWRVQANRFGALNDALAAYLDRIAELVEENKALQAHIRAQREHSEGTV
ncbi:hypothetical protein [Chitinimonas sp.]|uniref:hypothetical protein n=1 Tax=Chitinimonas sp. TaxID=1934313 RepID=UPI0035B070DA